MSPIGVIVGFTMTNTTTITTTLTRNNDRVTFSRKSLEAKTARMSNSFGESAILSTDDAMDRIHRLIDDGWRLAA
jgi:hypothetical protein